MTIGNHHLYDVPILLCLDFMRANFRAPAIMIFRDPVVNGRVGWLSDRKNINVLGHISSSGLHYFGSRAASSCMLGSKGAILLRYADLQLGCCASGDTRI